jgi:hypothetical protein
MGLGASHQTGWTALVAELIRDHCNGSETESTAKEIKIAEEKILVDK